MDVTTACPIAQFDAFVNATTFKSILTAFRQLCLVVDLDPIDHSDFYKCIRTKIRSWKAEKLWKLLDQRSALKEYKDQKACRNMKVLIIGAGPCGLRAAIECALLGCARTVVLECRDKFSRNNVLHLWPFVNEDLKNLGAKIFYPRFCAGAVDHISIRQLQCILLKVALVLGVDVHPGVTFEELILPAINPNNGETVGWRADVTPQEHYLSEYEFDAVIAADGKRNSLPGFPRREMRGKLAIGITANFVNRRTHEEERVPEISGLAFVFNQQFFKDMKEQTAIDLENVVYYKNETHYFVMCAKKQSLIDKGVILQDSEDPGGLLQGDNVDQAALLAFAREAADFVTNGALPRLDYALNHAGLPDVAMFDFTSLFSAEHSCRVLDRNGRRLLMGIVGDSLHEPFWPTGSGVARGFFGVFDQCWLLHGFACRSVGVLPLIAERETVYRLLAQTTAHNTHKNIAKYTLDPRSRYPQIDVRIRPDQVTHLVDTDNPELAEEQWMAADETADADSVPERRVETGHERFHRRQQQLLQFIDEALVPYKIRCYNFTSCWRDGRVLCALLDRFRPELLHYSSLSWSNESDYAANRRLAFDMIEKEFELPPPTDDDDWLDGRLFDTSEAAFATFEYACAFGHCLRLCVQQKLCSLRVGVGASVVHS